MSIQALLPRPSVAFIPTPPYRHCLRWLKQLGHDPDAVLAKAGIDHQVIRREGVLTLDQAEAFALTADHPHHRATDLGQEFLYPAFGHVGFAALTAPTVSDALDVAARFMPMVEPLFELRHWREGAFHRVEFSPMYCIHPRVFEIHVKLVWSAMHALANYSLGTFPSGVRVATPFEDADLREFMQARNAQLSSSLDALRVWLPAAVGDAPMPMADRQAHIGFIKQCEQQLRDRPPRNGTTRAVRHALREAGPPFPKIDGLTASIGVSGRTLRRRLSREGVSYQDLLTEARFTWAARELACSDRSIAELSLDLGYSAPTSFARAFKRALNTSPAQYRRSAEQAAGDASQTKRTIRTSGPRPFV